MKACSDILSCFRRRTSESSLVFPTSTLVRTILLQAAARRNNCSSFQIQFSISHFHPQALSSFFRNLHWESIRFHELQCGRILLDYFIYLLQIKSTRLYKQIINYIKIEGNFKRKIVEETTKNLMHHIARMYRSIKIDVVAFLNKVLSLTSNLYQP